MPAPDSAPTPTPKTDTRSAQGSLDPAQMERAVRAYFAAVGRGDRQALLDLFAPDLRWRVPRGAIEPYAGLHEGAESVVDMMLSSVGQAFVAGSQKSEIRTQVFGPNLAVLEVEMRATTPAGEQYLNEYTFFFEFRGERIAEIREYVDTRHAANFFGQGNA